MLERREFLHRAGLVIGAAAASTLLPGAEAEPDQPAPAPLESHDWRSVRAQFPLASDKIHLASFFLVSHPRPVAEAIERYRRALDLDPIGYVHEHNGPASERVRIAAAKYMGAQADLIALTESTTMGLGLVYGGLDLKPGQEIVSTVHDHYSTQMSLQHRAERTGAKAREISLYDDSAAVSVDGIVEQMRKAISDRTRVLAVTWVHSSTGVKLPVAEMSRALDEINRRRAESERVLFCVDGVHGFGVEDMTVADLGCDFLIAGTHKWLFGPRGTGLIWGRRDAWRAVHPVIPSFGLNYDVWLGTADRSDVPTGDLMSPGGFHSFEHRWATTEAFQFHMRIGKDRVAKRIHELNTMAKTELARMKHVKLRTPMSPELSSGIICFEVDGMRPDDVVARLARRGIIASTSPYRVSCARIAPSLVNDENEIERTIAEIKAMA